MSGKKIKVFLIDDHGITRLGVKTILDLSDSVEVVGEAINGHDTINNIKNTKADIFILDVSLPDMSGFNLIKTIRAKAPNSKIIIYSMHEESDIISIALQHKVNGYVSKGSDPTQLIQAIEMVYAGQNFFSEKISFIVVNNIYSNNPVSNSNKALTSRESEILKLIIEGQNNKEIATSLGISQNTVAIHRTNIMKKLGVKNAAELVSYTLKHNILNL